MEAKFRSLFLFSLAATASLAAPGCSFKRSDGEPTRVRIALPATARNARLAGGSSYNCFGINVTGDSIPTTNPLQGCVAAGMPRIGIVAGLVDASATSIDVSVPSGRNRVIQVFGIVSAAGCPGVGDLLTGIAPAASFQSPIELGRLALDLQSDASVTIQLDLTTADPNKRVFCLTDPPTTGVWGTSTWDNATWGP